MSNETLENILLEKLSEKLRPLIRQIIKEELEASSKEDKPKSILSSSETKELSQNLEDKLQKVADFIISHKKELGF